MCKNIEGSTKIFQLHVSSITTDPLGIQGGHMSIMLSNQ